MSRKTSSQCKGRWFQWLDPGILKGSFSASEDELLLELARVFENRWNTVASLTHRTSFQCAERFKVLEREVLCRDVKRNCVFDGWKSFDVCGCEAVVGGSVVGDFTMDEMEMLSEARARLANTRGKKAKRRERQKKCDLKFPVGVVSQIEGYKKLKGNVVLKKVVNVVSFVRQSCTEKYKSTKDVFSGKMFGERVNNICLVQMVDEFRCNGFVTYSKNVLRGGGKIFDIFFENFSFVVCALFNRGFLISRHSALEFGKFGF